MPGKPPGKPDYWIAVVIGVGLLIFGGCSKDSQPQGSATKGQSPAASQKESAQKGPAQKGPGEEPPPGEESGPRRPVGHDPADLAGKFPPLAALPEVPVPADNPITPAKVELGRLLFFENRLSGDIEFSCASCHDPARGWGDEHEISTGYPGTRHWRNSQTVVNSAYLQKLFWGGESTSLEAQAKSAITGNLAGNGEPALIEERLAQIPEYVRRFQEAFGVGRPRFPLVLKAIATFERAEVISRDSAFDRYMRGDKSAMSESALRGKALFQGKAGCIQCHNGPLLSDENFHNLGVPKNPFFERDSFAQIALRYQHYIRGVPEEIYREADHDMGLYYTTKRTEDQGKFRTPPLRYLPYSFPFMHNGVFLVLEEVIDFYDQGGGDDPNKSPLLRPLGLTDPEKQDLIEFLTSLAGSQLIIDRPELPPYVATGI